MFKIKASDISRLSEPVILNAIYRIKKDPEFKKSMEDTEVEKSVHLKNIKKNFNPVPSKFKSFLVQNNNPVFVIELTHKIVSFVFDWSLSDVTADNSIDVPPEGSKKGKFKMENIKVSIKINIAREKSKKYIGLTFKDDKDIQPLITYNSTIKLLPAVNMDLKEQSETIKN